ncbi:nucleotide-diphospho-sugar transferase [Syncephalastrum racemosum]|uniref:Nucleotide-diphospho-sugar transferase n=1 Tax=Syncephalastrum racemosum TaxID=13706 RepID=A0A1X2HMJ7_SYNRA|nr:nucleotide-diphospho-sugar transferase [Syncephalastrum racemosum]
MQSWKFNRRHAGLGLLGSITLALLLISFYFFASPAELFRSNEPHTWKSFLDTSDVDHEPVRACYVILVRNSELDGIISSITQLEKTFNDKYNYPYVFLNDEEFTDEFKERTSGLGKAQKFYGTLDSHMWGYPPFINQTLAAERRKEMAAANVIYGDSESYRHMCRFQSGFFFRHPLLDPYDYYWRVEPNVDFLCDIDYDVFQFMKDNRKLYGFTLTFKEFMTTIPSLWDTVRNFKRDHPEVMARLPAKEDSMIKFITDDDGETYNSCHFWTNFEIASFSLWRSTEYLKYFNYLDKTGNFFYERWGDAPVHSIAAAMMLRKEEVHFFHDVGYRHTGVMHCPVGDKYRDKCSCKPTDPGQWDYYLTGSCLPNFDNAVKT